LGLKHDEIARGFRFEFVEHAVIVRFGPSSS
jgi:hypothetical protein